MTDKLKQFRNYMITQMIHKLAKLKAGSTAQQTLFKYMIG